MLYSEHFQNRILGTSVGIGTIVLVSLFTFHLFWKPKKKVSRIIDTFNYSFSVLTMYLQKKFYGRIYSVVSICSAAMMEALKKQTVHIKDRDYVEDVVSQLIKGGASKLQVISDFDLTLSRVHLNGEKCATTYGILKQPQFITESYRYQSSCLFDYYHPIEIDPHLTKAQKVPYMIEWYTKGVDLFPLSGITKDRVPEMVAASNVCLRDGCDAIFESLYKHSVPLLIFSAGVGDILKEILKQQNLLFPNVKIIANFLNFSSEDKLLGYKGDIIHTFNKNQSSIENSNYFNTLSSRNNIILLGDSLGDLDMAEGAKNVNAILKIGFLNNKIEEFLPEYMDTFDIVLTDDQTMDVVLGLLQSAL